jgi:hypothetical protein
MTRATTRPEDDDRAAPDKWFRSTAWDDAARADFDLRLSRARPGDRAQFLRIKALALKGVGQLDAARTLLDRVLDQPQVAAHEAAFATEVLGDIAAQEGDTRLAESHYRNVLDAWPSLAGTTGTVEISLAEVLTRDNNDPAHREALELLSSYLARPSFKFTSQLFRWHLALILVAEQTGDRATVRHSATTALELAGRGPQLPRHKDVGLVHTDEATLRRLRRLAR